MNRRHGHHGNRRVYGDRPYIEGLERRVLLSADVPGATDWVDMGEYYWHEGIQIPLVRSADKSIARLQSSQQVDLLEQVPGVKVNSLSNEWAVIEGAVHLNLSGGAQEFAAGSVEIRWSAPLYADAMTGKEVYLRDEIIISLKAGVALDDVLDPANFGDIRPLRWMEQTFMVAVASGGSSDVLTLANALHVNPLVKWATPDFGVLARGRGVIPNDAEFGNQWNLEHTAIPDAWDVTMGSSDIVIAVLDSGVDLSHPDLSANIWTNPNEIPGNGIDDDLNGFEDDVHGWNFLDGTSDVTPDDSAHGTFVAGVSAAVANNSIGIAGAAPNIKIMPIKIFDGPFEYLPEIEIAEAFDYAFSMGADIINLSDGGYTPNQVLTDAINNAAINGRGGLGIPVFAAADNFDRDSFNDYPANLANTILVASSGENHLRVTRTGWGDELDFLAPGGGPDPAEGLITSTDIAGSEGYESDDYATSWGASFATALSSGIGALLISTAPNLTAAQVRQIMRDSAEKIGGPSVVYDENGFNDHYGHGRVNARAALDLLFDMISDEVPTNPRPTLIAEGDFNGDTWPDLVTWSSTTHSLRISWNQGDGTFSYAPGGFTELSQTTFPAFEGMTDLLASDIDADGDIDLLFTSTYDTSGGGGLPVHKVWILRNPGGGQFAAQNLEGHNVQFAPRGLVTGDFNGDAKLDIAVVNWFSGSVTVLFQQSDNTFDGSNPADTSKRRDIQVVSAPFGSLTSIAVGQFGGDAKLDLAVTDQYNGKVHVLMGQSGGNFGSVQSVNVTGGERIAVGDFNDDGKDDMAVTSGSLPISVLYQNSAGGFQGATVQTLAAEGVVIGITVGDFNGDLIDDFAAVNQTAAIGGQGEEENALFIYYGLLGGINPNGRRVFNVTVIGDRPWDLVAGDWDKDGKMDLAITMWLDGEILLIYNEFGVLGDE